MKKAALLFGMLLMAAPANADLITKHSTSVQLTVDAAASQATRLGSSYSVSGSNVSATLGGLTAPVSATDAATMNSGTYTQTTAGSAFSFTETFNQGDAIPTGTTVSSGVVGTLPAFGSVTTTAGGVAGSLAGTIDSAGTMSLTAGGAGTSATGQFVSEITIK
jgi:hypothetical protein